MLAIATTWVGVATTRRVLCATSYSATETAPAVHNNIGLAEMAICRPSGDHAHSLGPARWAATPEAVLSTRNGGVALRTTMSPVARETVAMRPICASEQARGPRMVT